MKWNTFIEGMMSKASKRLHKIRVLKRNGVPVTDLKHIYTALIRSVLEYCAPVWHTQIPTFLSDELEKVQRRALRILHPDKHYSEALILTDCPVLSDKRANLCTKTFSKICTPQSRLNHLVPKVRLNAHSHLLRNNQSLTHPRCRTKRFKRSFYQQCVLNIVFN